MKPKMLKVQDPMASLANTVICGDSRTVLTTFPADSIDCIVTSPPYFQQRNYAAGDDQIGSESTTVDYMQNLTAIFSECRRVLKPEGTLWLNLGDKYTRGALQGMPWRVCFALQDQLGFMLRSDIIWHKPNAMPTSAKNRPTTDHEYIFLLTKTTNYFYDADAIREPHVTFSEKSKMRGGRNHFGKVNGTPERGKNSGNSNLHGGRWDQAFHPKGRNKRTVWSIPLSKFRGAHFAVFPEALVLNCITAGCIPSGIVLDPFSGSGTTALVAAQCGRRYIGIDLSPDYCEMSRDRLRRLAPKML